MCQEVAHREEQYVDTTSVKQGEGQRFYDYIVCSTQSAASEWSLRYRVAMRVGAITIAEVLLKIGVEHGTTQNMDTADTPC